MSSDESPAPQAAPSQQQIAAAVELQKRRAAHLKLIRAMPASQYIATQTAEVLAAALVSSPVIFLPMFVNAIVNARFPRQDPGLPKPAIPQTFGGLFAAGLRGGAMSTFRVCMWGSGTAALSAIAREGMKVGPRYEDGIDSHTSKTAMWVNAASGGLVSYLIMGSVHKMAVPRRLLFASMGAMSGVMLPWFMVMAGPRVRREMTRWLGSGNASSGGGGGGAAPSAPMQ